MDRFRTQQFLNEFYELVDEAERQSVILDDLESLEQDLENETITQWLESELWEVLEKIKKLGEKYEREI